LSKCIKQFYENFFYKTFQSKNKLKLIDIHIVETTFFHEKNSNEITANPICIANKDML